MQNKQIENALDWAGLHGVLKYLPNGQLTHTPFSLNPYPISESALKEMTELTAPFSELMIRVSRDWEFLEQYLKPIAKTDPFLRILLDCKKKEITQNQQLLIQRNDFFVTDLGLRQVELNTISASFPFLMSGIFRMHKRLLENAPETLKRLVANNPLEPIVDAFARAVQNYDAPESVMLVVIQPCESNRFDQRGLEKILWEKHEIPTLRKTLAEIAVSGNLKNGHLILDGKIVALTYYRAGYTPDDFQTPEAVKGRQLLENSSTIQVPDLPMQLSGMKKIQQILTHPEVLSAFVAPETAKRLSKTFAGMYALDEILETPEGSLTATQWALSHPEKFVLKPQREGGGNNFFGDEIPEKLANLPEYGRNTYILMERIEAQSHSATLVVNGQAETSDCVSEIGRYGICFADSGQMKSNRDVGYLVRTKAKNINEGGVCAGYACLNSLLKEVR